MTSFLDSAHTTAAYGRDVRLLSGIIAAHLGVDVAELGVGALTVPVLRTATGAAPVGAPSSMALVRRAGRPRSTFGGRLGQDAAAEVA